MCFGMGIWLGDDTDDRYCQSQDALIWYWMRHNGKRTMTDYSMMTTGEHESGRDRYLYFLSARNAEGLNQSQVAVRMAAWQMKARFRVRQQRSEAQNYR